MRLRLCIPLAASIVCALPGKVVATSAMQVGGTLVADINQNVSSVVASSAPYHLVTSGQIAYFRASHPWTGEEIWRSDGTAAGTFALADIQYGALSSMPRSAVALPGGGIVFVATESSTGSELWGSDGTPGGTTLLADIWPGPLDGEPWSPVLFQSEVWFLADDGVHGRELWKTDGTAAGTSFMGDVLPGLVHFGFGRLAAAGSTLYIAVDFGPTFQLWTSDGTVAGTTFLRSFAGDFATSLLTTADVNGRLVFDVGSGSDEGHWSSDGTLGGTVQLSTSSRRPWIVELNGTWLLPISTAAQGLELWKTDGTPGGTVLVRETAAGVADGISVSLGGEMAAVLGNRILYRGTDGSAIEELLASDGTAAGTGLLTETVPGVGTATPNELIAWNGRVFFFAGTLAEGNELWVTDGTAAGTGMLGDLTPGPADGTLWAAPGFPAGAAFLFPYGLPGVANPPGIELWASDGTPGGTGLLANIAPEQTFTASSRPEELVRLGDVLYFSADDGQHGRELWRSDGTAAGTYMVADILAGPQASNPSSLTVLGDRILFAAEPEIGGWNERDRELYVTDGTAAGTHELVDLAFGTTSSDPDDLTRSGDRVFFTAFTAATGRELWVTDGTAAGTALTRDASTVVSGITFNAFPSGLTPFRGGVVYAFDDGSGGVEPWYSNGTAGGTNELLDVTGNGNSSYPRYFTASGGSVFFSALTPALGWELYVTNGTPAGTGLVADLHPGTTSSGPTNFAPLPNGNVVFNASDPVAGFSIWTSDGTGPGTTLVWAPPVGQLGPPIFSAVSAGASVLFLAPRPPVMEVWRTDGTLAGTMAVHSFPYTSTTRMAKVTSDARGVFAASAIKPNEELWVSDGTSAGTTLVAEIHPAPLGSGPRDILRVGDRVFFVADDGLTGRELHVVPVESTGGWVAEPVVRGCAGALGVPAIEATGAAKLLSPLGFQLSNAAPVTLAFLLLDGTYTGPAPLGTCTFTMPQPYLLATRVTSGAGTAQVNYVVPNSLPLVGLPLYFQYMVLESNGPFFGIASLSDMLEVVVGF